ncbi:MAG TPA: recombination protein U [Erysipelotrichaceae bacterium]|nr:recombination protein U [Erysipelotrichaceae bacterium]HBZ41261.1 recombination protein U [Erysipelotrichaceae bacterium]
MVGYPTKKTPQKNGPVQSTSKRGMSLEDDLNKTNAYYLELDRANVHKKPTPIMIATVSYPSRSQAKITEAYFKVPSTTDYNGVYRCKAVDYEAKETQSKTSFALAYLHEHQIAHMRSVLRHGALTFMIIRFTSLDETYFVPADRLLAFIDTTTRRSIPILWIRENGMRIPWRLTPPIDYLTCVDAYYFKGEMLND